MDEFEPTSPAFEHGRSIPRKHTCEGEDVSPPLAWSGVPQGTASLALVVDDPGWGSGHEQVAADAAILPVIERPRRRPVSVQPGHRSRAVEPERRHSTC